MWERRALLTIGYMRTSSGSNRHQHGGYSSGVKVRTATSLPTSSIRRGLGHSERDGTNHLFVTLRDATVEVWDQTATRTSLHLHVLNRVGARDAGMKTNRRRKSA
jgi:hypothetical protein